MILISDNDILLKLAICDLLDESLAELGATHAEVFVLGTARFKLGIAKNPDKTKAKLGEAVCPAKIVSGSGPNACRAFTLRIARIRRHSRH